MATPQERFELSSWLSDLLKLTQNIEAGWARKAQIEQQYAAQLKPNKKPWRLIMGALLTWVVSWPLTFVVQNGLVLIPLSIAGGVAAVMIYNRKFLPKRNEVVQAANNEIWKRCTAELAPVNQQLDDDGAAFTQRFAQHFPNDYAYSDAVAFCLKAVQNHRADSVGSAINLYEQELHQQRLEQTQEAILEEQARTRRQQAVGMVVNTVMQGATISAIRSEGAANRAAGAASASMFRDELRKLR